MCPKKFAALGIVIFLAVAKSTYAQSTFSIQLDSHLLERCRYYSPSDVTVRIDNVTDPADTKLFAVTCGHDWNRWPVVREINLPGLHDEPLRLVTSWTDAMDWQITTQDHWVLLNGLSLPHQSYRLSSIWHDGYSREKQLLDQPFIVDAISGPSVHEFVIEEKGIFHALKDRYWGRQTAYVSIILLLTGLLTVAIRKRLERGIDQLLDQLGSYTKGKLAARRFLKRYFDFLLTTHKYLRLTGFGAAGINRPLLEEVFISLRVSAFDRKRNAPQSADDTDIPFETAVSRFSRLVILGGPGAGKTTVLSYITLQCLSSKDTSLFGFSTHYLPLYVPLRRLSNRETALLDDILSNETQIFPEDLLKECPSGFLKRHLERGQCIVLLDGLDEVLDEAAHRLAAEKINRMVTDFPKNRFIVTCRIAGWRGLLDNFAILEAKDLNRTEVHRFVSGWHRAVITQEFRNQIDLKYKSSEERDAAWQGERADARNVIDATSRRLSGSIEANARLMAIATNPMLLSLICLVHYVKNMLPRERPILYEKCVELLIDAWDRSRNIVSPVSGIDSYQKEAVLRAVAMAFQTGGKGEAPRREVEEIVEIEAKKLNIPMPGKELVQQMEQRSGILIERSIDVLGFSHLTLQEYLVAKHIQLNQADVVMLKGSFDNEQWREVILLYAGLIDDATSFIESMVEPRTPHRWLLAGYTLGEARRAERTLAETVLEELVERFEDAHQSEEAFLNVMAAVAADYTDQPILPEQALSARLMEHIRARDTRARCCIQALGKARITKALPLIVGCLEERDEGLLKDVVGSIVFFGNIAMPYIQACIRQASAKLRIPDVIALLQAIDTPEAAKLLVACYDVWREPVDHFLISAALAEMLDRDAIESELLTLRDADVPTAIPASFASEDIIWPQELEGRGHTRLCLKIRDDMTRMIDRSIPLELQKASFKVVFPAILYFLKTYKERIPKTGWQEMGFEGALEGQITVLERIHKEIRTGTTPVNESIRHLIKRRNSAVPVSKIVRAIRWPAEILLSLLTFADAVFLGYLVVMALLSVTGYSQNLLSDDPGFYPVMIVGGLAVIRFLGCCIWGFRIAGRNRRLIGAANSTSLILRRTPYLSPLRPWLNFALVQLLIGLSSWAGTVAGILLVIVFKGNTFPSPSLIIVLLSPYIAFVLIGAWFYKYQALNVDAAALLLMQHPRGRALLGLPPGIDSSLGQGALQARETTLSVAGATP